MSVCDAPQWLQTQWLRSCREIGVTASAEQVEETGKRLLNRWCRTERRFHNIKHLADVLQRLDEMGPELQRAALVRLAAFYHGVVFHTSQAGHSAEGGEDEISSAQLAESELLGLGAPAQAASRVAALVTALHDKTPHPGDSDVAALRDAELATLSVVPQRYIDYLRELRAEFSSLPPREFLEARRRVLTKLLARDPIFRTPHGAQWEAAARQNMTAELARVTKELGQLGDAADAATGWCAGPGQEREQGATLPGAASLGGSPTA